LAKPYGINLRYFKEHLGELEEPFVNPMETRKISPKKKSLRLPPPQRKKNWTPHECMMSLLVGCTKLFISKTVLSPFLAWANWQEGHKLWDIA
jgi:hypothetical protein